MSNDHPSPGPTLISALRDFRDVLAREEEPGSHYKTTTLCRRCCDPVEECSCGPGESEDRGGAVKPAKP